MKRIIFVTLLLTGTAISTPANAQAFECTGSIASMAVAAVDSVISMLGGGRASQIAQALQIKEAVIANFCAASINDSVVESNEYHRRNIAQGTANGIPGINGMIYRTNPWLGQGGFLSTEAAIQGQYGEVYPEMFPLLTPDELLYVNEGMRDHERNSQMLSFAIQNRMVQEQRDSLMRSRDYAAAGRAGEGMRAELQAANAIGGEQVAAMNAMTAATIGAQRAQTEIRMRDEAKKVASNATAEEFMSNLSVCANCSINRPFLGN